MGYVHNPTLSQFVPPTACFFSAGTWTLVVNSNVWSKLRTAHDSTFTTYIPIIVPSSSILQKGSYLKSVEFMYEISGAVADDFAYVRIYKGTLAPSAASGSGTINTAVLISTTEDTGHDNAAKRKIVDEHRMISTLDEPAWIDNDQEYHWQITVDCGAATNFYVFGAIINYTIRT